MALIGSFTVSILPGSRMRGPRRIVGRRAAPEGINGVEITRGAYDVPASIFATAATCASRAAALTIIAAYEALIGEDVTVVDGDGTSYPAVTVLDVVCDDPDPRLIIVAPDAPGDTWEVRARWLFQAPYQTIRPGAL